MRTRFDTFVHKQPGLLKTSALTDGLWMRFLFLPMPRIRCKKSIQSGSHKNKHQPHGHFSHVVPVLVLHRLTMSAEILRKQALSET